MDKLNRLSEQDRANLVAYLDGELDEAQTRRIESILASNPVARAEVEQLAKTYELLEALPRPRIAEEFTQRTVATARMEGFSVPLAQRPWFRQTVQWFRLAAWSLLMACSASAGYWLTHVWFPSSNDALLDDYPLIRHLDAYREVQGIEFLEVLRNQPDLVRDMQRGAAP